MSKELQRAVEIAKEIGFMLEKSQPVEKPNVHIRWMIRRDMPYILEIEEASFEFAWSEEEFIRCLRQRNCIGMVAEIDDVLVGYMIYELYKDRLELVNFSVSPYVRNLGVGTAMVDKLIGKLSSQYRRYIRLAIRESNLKAQLFFKSKQFVATDVLRDHYEDTIEDAYVFMYEVRK